MKDRGRSRLWIAFLSSTVLPAILCCTAQETNQPPTGWPRVIVRNGVTNTFYQPQLESWDNYTLKARSAVAIQSGGAPQPTFGIVDFTAKTRVDRAERTVYFDDIQISHVDFPSAPEKNDAYRQRLEALVPPQIRSISLDRLEASVAILEAQAKVSGQPLRNDPPTIIFSTEPALLLLVDGRPVYRPVEKTSLQRVLNTRALLLRDKTGKHYLHLFDGYVEAPSFEGPWTVAAQVPQEVKQAEKLAVASKQVDLLAGQPNPQTRQLPSLRSTPVPRLYVATTPTELIVIDGEPQWAPIPATQLLYVTNTASHVFKELEDQNTFVLISGRWFHSGSFAGPWAFVSGEELPNDFKNIPDDSPQENVKASVPGTRQAAEAAIANNIPQTTKVDRRKATMNPPPQYDGALQLKPIEGTPLSYVANSPTPVIQVNANSWYACQNGVWFTAASATGPWAVATSVPAVIYSIPPSCPLHYVVYSRIYNYDANNVWIGTTPGYYGTVVASDGLVVYGTGYDYPAYIGPATYISYSVTYGYGCNPCWTPWAGWAFGFAVGWATAANWHWWCSCPPAPYWGPYWGWCYGARYNAYGGITAWGPYGWAGTSGYIYHQNGPWTGVSRGAAGYNAWTGNQWATSYGRAYNSTTGTRVAGQRGAVENVYTGNYAYGGRGAFYNEQTGAAGVGRRVTWGNESVGNEGTAGRATVYNPNTGQAVHVSGAKGEAGGIVDVNNHVVAGYDGNFYRPNGQGGWEQITKPPQATTGQRQVPGGQTPAATARPQTTAPPRNVQSLNNEYSARQTGAQRQASFQMNRPAFRGGGGGGGRRR